METDVLAMPRDEAKQALAHYRSLVAERRTEEDEVIAQAYRQLARGRNLLDLERAFAAAGVDEAGLPRVAIARADATWVHLGYRRWWSQDGKTEVGRYIFGSDDRPDWIRASSRRLVWSNVPAGIEPFKGELRAQVPIVPPLLRPRGHLSRYHILFEIEEWAQLPQPPRDPLLLRRIRGGLFAVLAEWDLTEVERLVLATRQ